MKKVVLSLAIISLLCGIYLPCYASSSQAVFGDINLDGDLKVNDAQLALRCALNLEELTDAQRLAGDINFDGKITLYDARAILKLALGMSYEKPEKPSEMTTEKPAEKPTEKPTEKPVALETPSDKIEVSKVTKCRVGIGKTLKFVVPDGEKIVSWKSTNLAVGAIDNKGELLGITDGYTCVVVKTDKKKYYVNVDVLTELQEKINEYREIYPAGYYFNKKEPSEKYPLVSEYPCEHYVDDYPNVCRGQCAGFAYMMSNEIYGEDAKYIYYTEDNEIRVGDYVRYNNHHSIFIIDVIHTGEICGYNSLTEENIIADHDYYVVVHCNWDHKCGIFWDHIFEFSPYSKYVINNQYSYHRG